MKTMLVLGATSDMAQSIALKFGREGWNLLLAGRDLHELERISGDLSLRLDRPVPSFQFEAGITDAENFWKSLPAAPDAVLCAIGMLGDQMQARGDLRLAQEIVTANYAGLVAILGLAANEFEKRGSGLIIGISSVAGDRGRASNYIYGSAKAGFTAFLSGLRARLANAGVQVLTVKPGFAATRMTDGMNLPAALTASPEQIAEAVYRAVRKKRNVIYVKPIWRPVMAAVCLLPEFVFKKLKM